MVFVLGRGGYCPKDRRQHEGLLQLHRELEVGYCRLVTISTDRAYVFSIHLVFCVNVATEPACTSTAVLIRAIEPLAGIELMAKRRSHVRVVDRRQLP